VKRFTLTRTESYEGGWFLTAAGQPQIAFVRDFRRLRFAYVRQMYRDIVMGRL
jgi:hypothetical protein